FFIPTKKVQVNVHQKIFESIQDNILETYSPGICSTNWVDIDNDGDEDLFIGNKGYNKSNLFINKMAETGQPTFEAAASEGLWADSLSVSASSFGDYNNDGLEDLAAFSDQGSLGLTLFENAGNLKFNKREIAVSLNKTPLEILQSCSWVDLNHDNYLDLVFGYYQGARDEGGIGTGVELLNNKGVLGSSLLNCGVYNGNLLFSDILKEKGTELIRTYGNFGILVENGNCKMDWPNFKSLYDLNQYSVLKPITPSLGDFDNDLDLDIFCPIHNPLFYTTDNRNLFLENNSNTFQERTDLSPVLKEVDSTSGSVCFDFDNDGDLDLAVSNAAGKNELYRNLFMETGKLAFEPMIDDVFENEIGNWIGISASDINLDGSLDLTTVSTSGVHFSMNKMKGNNWLSVKCTGKVSNGSAIGAKVYAIAAINGKKTTQYREILAASGETSLNSKLLHFGLGNALKVDSLIIKWPSGVTNVLTNLMVNKYMEVTEFFEQIPLANAGNDQTVNEMEMVYLDGSASSDADDNVLSYRWTAPLGAILSASNEVNPTFIAPDVRVDTPFTFTLVVSDGVNESPVDQVTITIKQINKAPVAKAGPDQTITEGMSIRLNGLSSTDPDGNPLIYKWTAPAGISLSATNVPNPTFIAPITGQPASYTFDLTVNDGWIDSPMDQVIIKAKNINKRPVANAGIDKRVHEWETVVLNGTASYDADVDRLFFYWTAPVGIKLDSEYFMSPRFLAPQVKNDSILTFSLMVSDGKLNSDTTRVRITVVNDTMVDISNTVLSSVEFYPNPSTGIVNVEVIHHLDNPFKVSVTNMMGAEVFRKEIGSEKKFQINLSGLVDGIYLLKVSNGVRYNVNKLVISK
ncbi:MAG TPA: FG-GAP-like repeat-containing protein, partial [Prolixibacteraceae bacterium]